MSYAYLSVRVAPSSVKYCKGKSGKVSGSAIKAAIKAGHPVEFIDALTGKWLTVSEAAKLGVRNLNVRFNDDRDVVVITVTVPAQV
jgi:hypothetical protein